MIVENADEFIETLVGLVDWIDDDDKEELSVVLKILLILVASDEMASLFTVVIDAVDNVLVGGIVESV